jgi:hypothetical protein
MVSSAQVRCPYCGAQSEIIVDATSDEQRSSEPCSKCNRPMWVVIDIDDDGAQIVTVESEAHG